MALNDILSNFRAAVNQCDTLINSAHRLDASLDYIFTMDDRQQITMAAFLNMFVAWESFLESVLIEYMLGAATLNGQVLVSYVRPYDVDHARRLVLGVNRFFDYAKHDNFRKIANLYLDQGYPFELIISGMSSDLADLRTMRNASAHLSSSTQAALYALSIRILPNRPQVTNLYDLLISIDNRSTQGDTVFSFYKGKLLSAAQMIVTGYT
ncbi:hypothetical protein HAP94_08350 [Acidithiobacillus ferrivorans]|nr:hypothetical protein [Acidithiobacillus ferrivorans]